MKVLMFGWEFPPHILGGLGTASYGLTKGMSQQDDLEITFCIPKPWGDEDQSFLRIIGMNSTPVVWKNVGWDYVKGRVGSYMDPQLFYDLRDHIYADFNYLNTNDLGCIEFSGRYPDNLHEEINNYSIVAGVVGPFRRPTPTSTSTSSTGSTTRSPAGCARGWWTAALWPCPPPTTWRPPFWSRTA